MSLDSQKNYIVKAEKPNPFYKIFKTIFTKDKVTEVNIDDDSDMEELMESIKSARKEWLCATSNFNYANDQEIVDYYTYMIKACQVRYEYLIKKAKEKGMKGGFTELADIISYVGEAIN